jgi:hypothetical protein
MVKKLNSRFKIIRFKIRDSKSFLLKLREEHDPMKKDHTDPFEAESYGKIRSIVKD